MTPTTHFLFTLLGIGCTIFFATWILMTILDAISETKRERVRAERNRRIASALASIDYRKNLEGWKETRT